MTPRCVACGRKRLEQLAGPALAWRYDWCRSCGHASLSPRPTESELQQYYNDAYAVHMQSYLASAEPQARAVARMLGDTSPGRMLEIGCSYGAVLSQFRSRGWQVEGVEIDERAASWARDRHGLDVHPGALADVRDRLHPPYDVVACYHVIEHIIDPHAFLREVRELLPPDGILVLRTPNASSAIARLTKGWWEWCVVPEHVHLFSLRSLTLVLEQSGFTPGRTITRRGGAAGTLSELLRAAVRWSIPGAARRGVDPFPDSGAAEIGAGRPLRLASLRRVLDALGSPLDAAVAGAGRMGFPGGPEIMLVARRGEAGTVIATRSRCGVPM
ncbi:MAG: class I SAM-dependent methyltransferase [Gemmatimonadaceae bacterium]